MTDIFQSVVVYDSPKDHLGFFIARRWELDLKTKKLIPCEIIIRTKNYDDIYEKLSASGLHKILRNQEDDQAIKETWI